MLKSWLGSIVEIALTQDGLKFRAKVFAAIFVVAAIFVETDSDGYDCAESPGILSEMLALFLQHHPLRGRLLYSLGTTLYRYSLADSESYLEEPIRLNGEVLALHVSRH